MSAIRMVPVLRTAERYPGIDKMRYVRLRGETGGLYETKGYVRYDGSRIRIDTYSSSLTEALAEEIEKGLLGSGGDAVLENLKNVLNTPVLSASGVMRGRPQPDKGRIVYGADVFVPTVREI
ncbi:MAG: hypothetical protein WAX07_00650 [Candidatus Altiarchaeia archaeon]